MSRTRGVGLAVLAGGAILGLSATALGADPATVAVDQVSFCHKTQSGTNPYVPLSTSPEGVLNGHLDHQWGKDIIPPFNYVKDGPQTFPGQNWSQALWDNQCFALDIAKTSDLKTVQPGAKINYTITVTNLGGVDIPLSSIDLVDPLADLTPPAQPPSFIAAGKSATWTAVSKAAVPEDSAVCGTTITNTATVSFKPAPETVGLVATEPLIGLLPQPTSKSSTAETTVVCPPGVSITKTATNGPVAPGGSATYDIVVTNTGWSDIPLSDIKVTDVGADLVNPTTPTTLAHGDTATWTATKLVDPETPCTVGEVSNTASVALAPPPNAPALVAAADPSATATTPVVCPVNVGVAKTTTTTTVVPGAPVPYDIIVTNTGAFPVPFSAITVTDDGATVTPPIDPPTFLAPNASLTWTASKLAADGTAACGTTVANTAQVTLVGLPAGYAAVNPDGATSAAPGVTIGGGICNPAVTPASIPSDVQIAAAARPTLSVRKSGPAIARRGTGVIYRITVTNNGPVAATDVVLTDTPPTSMVIGRTPAGATRSGRTLSWALGTLNANETRTVTVAVGIRATARGTACNTASAVATNASAAKGKACTRVAVPRVIRVTG